MLPLLQSATPPGWVETQATELATWLTSLPEALRGVALAVATFISEDLTTIFAGLLVARDELSFTTALVGCTLGIWIGDGGIWTTDSTHHGIDQVSTSRAPATSFTLVDPSTSSRGTTDSPLDIRMS